MRQLGFNLSALVGLRVSGGAHLLRDGALGVGGISNLLSGRNLTDSLSRWSEQGLKARAQAFLLGFEASLSLRRQRGVGEDGADVCEFALYAGCSPEGTWFFDGGSGTISALSLECSNFTLLFFRCEILLGALLFRLLLELGGDGGDPLVEHVLASRHGCALILWQRRRRKLGGKLIFLSLQVFEAQVLELLTRHVLVVHRVHLCC
jgi:hypothetical protein